MNAWRFLAVVLLLAAMPLQADVVSRLVGHWLGSFHGKPIDLRINADGTGSYQGQPIRWQARYGQLRVDRGGEVDVYAMKVDGGTLLVAGGEMATLLVLMRVPETVAPDGEPE